MKKIVLTLASVLAATAFAPEAAAIPSFARQTGMACNSCHFQTFPALTAFGRSFKTAGYTMMGAQGKVEGEHGLSIPDTLNASIYVQLRYIKTGGKTDGYGGGKDTNYGRYDWPDEFALFFGGRVSENVGALVEYGANWKLPMMFDVGGMKVGAVPFSTNGLGAGYGFDLFATGSNGGGRINENGMGYGAALYMGSTNNPAATGVALVAANDDFHVNLTQYAATPSGSVNKLGGTYLRAAWTPNLGGMDVGVGIQNWSGNSSQFTANSATAPDPLADPNNAKEDKLMVIDGQAQGEYNGMPVGLYASYGTAAATSAGAAKTNTYNNGTKAKTALGLMADVWVMPATLGLQIGMMRAQTGQLTAAGAAETDNSFTIGAWYKLRQNVKLGFAYTKFSGTAYETTGSGGANAANYSTDMTGNGERGTSRMTMILSAGF